MESQWSCCAPHLGTQLPLDSLSIVLSVSGFWFPQLFRPWGENRAQLFPLPGAPLTLFHLSLFPTLSSNHPNLSVLCGLSCWPRAWLIVLFESEKVYFPGYILMIWKIGENEPWTGKTFNLICVLSFLVEDVPLSFWALNNFSLGCGIFVCDD